MMMGQALGIQQRDGQQGFDAAQEAVPGLVIRHCLDIAAKVKHAFNVDSVINLRPRHFHERHGQGITKAPGVKTRARVVVVAGLANAGVRQLLYAYTVIFADGMQQGVTAGFHFKQSGGRVRAIIRPLPLL